MGLANTTDVFCVILEDEDLDDDADDDAGWLLAA